jgi:hypothetical protein
VTTGWDADGSAVTAEKDPELGTIRFGEVRAGPADVATLSVSEQLVVIVDVADPTAIGALVTPDPFDDTVDRAELDVLARLFGTRAAETAGSPPRPVGAPDGAFRQAVARLALALQGHDDDLTALGPRAGWSLDVTVALEAVEPTVTLRHRRDAARSEILELASRTDPIPASSATELALRAMADVGPELSDRVVSRLTARLEVVSPVRAPSLARYDVGKVRLEPNGGYTRRGLLTLDPRAVDGELVDPRAEASVAWDPVDGGLELSFALLPRSYLAGLANVWARAYRPDGTLLGLGEVRAELAAGGATAGRSRLRTGRVGIDEVVVDVAEDPSRRPSSAARRAFDAAAATGAAAASLERLGSWERAADAWRAAADRWDGIDDERARTARSYAADARAVTADAPPRVTHPPFFGETLVEG